MLETAAAQNAIRDACALTHAHATEVDLQTRIGRLNDTSCDAQNDGVS